MNVKELFNKNKSFLALFVLIVTVKSSMFDWNHVPTGSMRPTLADGDQILINKLAYDINIPLTHKSIFKFSNPLIGDIVVFDSKKQGIRMVKRVLGTPGDIVQIKDNKLFINNRAAIYADYTNDQINTTFKELDDVIIESQKTLENNDIDVSYKWETLGGLSHPIRIETGVHGSTVRGIQKFEIPKNKYLAIGDNRNNSFDSRFWGLVDRSEIIGNVNYVIFSLNQNNNYLPRKNRFLEKITNKY